MTSYRQDITFIEDDYGKTTVTFMISDEHGGLLTDSAIETNIFDLSDITLRFEEDGEPSQSELSLEINEAFARNLSEHAAASFIAAAVDPSVKRFCAVFFDTGATPLFADMIFQGVVEAQLDREFIHWGADEWETTVDLLAEAKFTAKPLQESILDGISLRDLIEGDADGGGHIPQGIDETWESVNVADRAGYYSWAIGSLKCHNLVSLDTLLRKLADNAETVLASQSIGTYTIEFERSILPGAWQPARWKKLHGEGFLPFSSSGEDVFETPEISDVHTLAIDPDAASPDNSEQVWINYAQIKPADEEDELLPEKAEDFLWYNLCSTFTDLLYAIAENFGMILQIWHSDTSTIKIKFVRIEDFNVGQIYLRAPEKASLKSAPEFDPVFYRGFAFYGIGEGFEAYRKDNPGAPVWRRARRRGSKGFRGRTGDTGLLLTISPTICDTSYRKMLPHNMTPYRNGGSESTDARYSTKGVHTAIYMYVTKLTGETDCPDNYWTPCRAFYVNVDGDEYGYDRLADFLNGDKDRSVRYYDAELSLDVPGWRWFSPNADGSSPRLPRLGDYITLNGSDYTVTKVEIMLDEPRIQLTLHGSDRFDGVVEPTTPDLIEETPIFGGVPADVDDARLANGEFAAGNLMSLRSDGKVEASVPTDDHYDRVYGFALNSGLGGDYCALRLPGKRFESENFGFDSSDVGKQIWLRRVAESANNVSLSPLTAAIADPEENFYFSPGVITGENEIIINFGIKAILK